MSIVDCQLSAIIQSWKRDRKKWSKINLPEDILEFWQIEKKRRISHFMKSGNATAVGRELLHCYVLCRFANIDTSMSKQKKYKSIRFRREQGLGCYIRRKMATI